MGQSWLTAPDERALFSVRRVGYSHSPKSSGERMNIAESVRSKPEGMPRARARPMQAGWLLTAVMVVLACDVTAPKAAEPVAERIYQAIMSAHPRYPRSTAPKALTGCFDWAKSTPEDPDVRYLAVAWRMAGRGGLALPQIVNRAIYRCEYAQRRDEAPCVCQVIDRNGKNVIEPPPGFVQRFE